VLLAEQGLASSRDGRRIELSEVALGSTDAPAPAPEERPELTGAR
jgi:hypothetical protein